MLSSDVTYLTHLLHALQTIGGHIYTLEFSFLSGGAPTVIASISDGTTLATVGWTTM
jgi:hypothetical protein